MDHPCSDGGLESDRIGCTKFCEWCTKCFEGCTKDFKVCSEVGIGPQWLPYGFLNEVMDHRCSDGGLESDRIGCTKFNKGCTKFNEGCTKFCEGCTKGSKDYFKVGNDLQSLLKDP